MAKKRLSPGRHRVEAWIYGVINPLAEALERESVLGRGRSPTYRWRTYSLERILSLRGYLSRGAVLILEDLASENRDFLKLERRHDALVERLRAAAHVTFKALVENAEFRAFVEKHFSKVSDDSEFVHSDVAEDLVNDVPEYVNAKAGRYQHVWNRCLPELKALRQRFQYDELEASLAGLRQGSERMLAELVALRSKLVQEFDVPPAPIGL